MKADLLNRILKLRSSESDVLKSTNSGLVESNIRSRRTISSRELGLRINMRGRGFAVKHPNTVKELMSILPLIIFFNYRSSNEIYTEEVVQRAQVLDGKLSAKTICKLAKELMGACC